MKNHKLAWAVTILLVVAAIALGQFKAPVQQSDRFFVTDAANLFSAQEEDAILVNCQSVAQMTGARMVVVTVNNTGLRSMQTYTEKLWDDWKLSSVDMLLVLQDDDYYFLYGSELWDKMDDNYRDLLDRYLEPQFAVGNYGEAVQDFVYGAEAVLLSTDNIGYEDGDYEYYGGGLGGSLLWAFVIVLVIIVVVLAVSKNQPASKRSYYGGYATPRPASRPIVIHTTTHRPSPRPTSVHRPVSSSRPVSRPASRPSSFGGGGRRSGGSFGGGGGRGGGSRGGGGRR